MSKPLHVAVIGAGIYGVSTALHLVRDGCRVTLIDRNPPGDPRQTSYGNAGIVARAAVAPVSVPGLLGKLPGMLLDPDGAVFLRWRHLLAAAPWIARFLAAGRESEVRRIAAALASLLGDAVEAHEALARETGAAQFLRRGPYVYLYRDRDAFLADRFGFALRKAHGFGWEERDRARLEADDPALGPGYGFGVALDGHAWIEDPGAYVLALAEAARRLGCAVRAAAATDLRPNETGVAVTLDDGAALAADRAVIACGAWSARLAARLGFDARLEAERGYHLTLEGPSRRPPFPYMLADAKLVATPMTRAGAPALRLAGLVEIGGLEAGPSPAPLALIERKARQLYPGIEWRTAEPWLGHRPSTPDSLPYLCRVPGAERIALAFGGQHVGLTSGPKAGRLVADLVQDRRPNIDLAPFAAVRP